MTIFSQMMKNPDFYQSQILQINKEYMIILSLYPVTKGHVLVIPRDEVGDLSLLKNPGKLFKTTIFWAEKLKSKLQFEAYTLKINNKLYLLENKGHINHLHMHIIPRYSKKDKVNIMPIKADQKDLLKVKELIL